jgi:hypothetical protein
MICTKCGSENEDDRRFCGECGHKLQSEQPDQSGSGETGEGADRAGLFSLLAKPASGGGLGRYVEAWAYALALLALGFALIRLDQAWLLYLLVPLAAAALRFRGL